MLYELTSFFLLIVVIFQARSEAISAYKIGYYEMRMKLDGIDISHVKNKTFMDIIFFKD